MLGAEAGETWWALAEPCAYGFCLSVFPWHVMSGKRRRLRFQGPQATAPCCHAVQCVCHARGEPATATWGFTV
jgi:hypothetical protein